MQGNTGLMPLIIKAHDARFQMGTSNDWADSRKSVT